MTRTDEDADLLLSPRQVVEGVLLVTEQAITRPELLFLLHALELAAPTHAVCPRASPPV